MQQTGHGGEDFVYGAPADNAGRDAAPSLSIYADRPHLRATLREDAAAAGLRVHSAQRLDELEDDHRGLSDVVLVDCPQVDGAALAALAALDMRAQQAGARLIVSTTVDALDDVFACMDQSFPVLLVNPDRAERVIALGQVLARFPSARLRELSEDDRLMLLRLTEQVGQIAGRMERLDPRGGVVPVAPPAPVLSAPTARGETDLPDAKLVRRIIRQRQLRARFLEGDLFADPAWDMLLDLTAARIEGKRVSVTSLCIAANVPPTTALRWIGQLVDAGLFVRVSDDADKRRAFIALSDTAAAAMARYFAEITPATPLPV
ncbi:MarR family transcriptional regulator [Novosphingobium sp. Leaf2]|uniref:MarR family transcriptional regulator n=1 Tax=Novosphingobium sp. Leaf2 TaxID=1735670 RepID=UPI0006FF458D|nr:MarR family transcriptional regulator [Novosphingobium sp. Leaf2]KQM19637.1 hypothetical protein ASE49_05345 [Novosphingobium sp. Leaf2]